MLKLCTSLIYIVFFAEYAKKLEEAGVPTEFYVAKGVPHGFYTSEGKIQLNVLQLSVESNKRVQADYRLNAIDEILLRNYCHTTQHFARLVYLKSQYCVLGHFKESSKEAHQKSIEFILKYGN